jgi:hypothetical protein
MAKFTATYADDEGNPVTIEGESHEAMASDLPADFSGNVTVYDEHGFKRGHIGRLLAGSVDWSAT